LRRPCILAGRGTAKAARFGRSSPAARRRKTCRRSRDQAGPAKEADPNQIPEALEVVERSMDRDAADGEAETDQRESFPSRES